MGTLTNSQGFIFGDSNWKFCKIVYPIDTPKPDIHYPVDTQKPDIQIQTFLTSDFFYALVLFLSEKNLNLFDMTWCQKVCKKRGQRYQKIKLTGCERVMHFLTICCTLHIATSPHHCAANHAVNCKNPTDLTRCDPHEYYQVNCCLVCVTQYSMLRMVCCNG